MTQTVTQNSVLSQNWVKCTVCTHPWPRLRAGLAMSWPCHRLVVARTRALTHRVAELCHDTRPCHRPLPVTIQNLYHDPSPYRARTAHRVTCAATHFTAPNTVSWRIATPYRSPGALYRDPGAVQLTIQTLYRSILTWPGCARCASCRKPPRPCCEHSQPYRGCARPCCAPLLARPGLRACSACCVPARLTVCLLGLLCACSACCVPAQPAVCLLSLLCATIQPSVL